jgi:hypothetical protein
LRLEHLASATGDQSPPSKHGVMYRMTDDEVRPYVGKAVRLTLDDRRVLAGTLHQEDGHGHGHGHYTVVSDPVREGGAKVRETIHGAQRITTIEDASKDPAAVE